MYCLKCGKDTVGSNVFCDTCLQVMEAYPIKPGTAIQLPRRKPVVPIKKPRRKVLSPEEQIELLRVQKRGLSTAVVILVILLGMISGLLAYHLTNPPEAPNVMGRNYTIDTTGNP